MKLEFSPSGLLIYGKNGCGKTNLLEAISYFSFGKSIRLLSDAEVIEFGKDEFFLKGNFTVSGNLKEIKLKSNGDKKFIYIDGNLIKKTTELYKHIKTVYFSPLDIDIVQGYPANRRRFFDIAISQYDFRYLELLKQYNRVLKQRNALLKSEFLSGEKDVWDYRFLQLSKAVIYERLKYLELFNKEIDFFYKKIAKDREEMTILYYPKYDFNENKIEDTLKNELKTKREDEKNLQRTLFGPHLHEYNFLINGLKLKKFGSQGQKRSFVIALRLAQAKLINISHKDSPILIFDDVLSELDSERSENIFELLGDKHQIFIATPHQKAYSPLKINSLNLIVTA